MSLGSRLSHQLYGSDKHKTMYMAEAFSSQGYDPNYFVSSPYEELLHPLSLSMDHLFQSRASPSQASDIPFDSYQTNFDVECSSCPNQETSEYNEDSMRLKLQELERALLVDDDAVVSLDHLGMELEGEWTSPIGCLTLQNSPKESSSSDSNLSSISSNKQVTLLPPLPRTSKELLFDGATAISEGNLERAAAVINELRQTVSIQGNPSQRIAAYMVEGLAARLAASGKILYKALKCKEPPSSDRLAAMQILFEVCPCFNFGFMAANGVIMGAFRSEKKAHIIDFDINQGSQYISLIQSLAKQPGKLPQIRLTGVDDPESVQRPVGGLNLIGQRLEKLAEALDVPFKFQSVPANVSAVTPAMLGCWAGKEAIIVNFAFQLHHMPDESVSTVN
ncbi:hypothetical protein Nepgr_002726 [Nepenthes gracilis]|uniref:Scarecrow-like protein 1 n=1 Tax=Nepenthes gracilis TaxID=150966 RepID=A0AAD3RX67_NEPGR|nr:hypothetical protein Nepgr_002726 [Nepenthes gracilis]